MVVTNSNNSNVSSFPSSASSTPLNQNLATPANNQHHHLHHHNYYACPSQSFNLQQTASNPSLSEDGRSDMEVLQPLESADSVLSENQTSRSFRSPEDGPLRKLSIDMIKTYKRINEVNVAFKSVCMN